MIENILKLFKNIGGAASLIVLAKWLYSRDDTAVEKCLPIICNLQNGLEKLDQHMRNLSRHPDSDFKKLLELKPIIEELNLHKRKLLFKPPALSKGVRESLALFSRLNNPGPANTPHFIAAELKLTWGFPIGLPYEARILKELQRFLEKSFFCRWIQCIRLWARYFKKFLPFSKRKGTLTSGMHDQNEHGHD